MSSKNPGFEKARIKGKYWRDKNAKTIFSKENQNNLYIVHKFVLQVT